MCIRDSAGDDHQDPHVGPVQCFLRRAGTGGVLHDHGGPAHEASRLATAGLISGEFTPFTIQGKRSDQSTSPGLPWATICT